MADLPTILKLIQNRLPTTHKISSIKNEDIVVFQQEVMVRKGFSDNDAPVSEDTLTLLQKGYIADLTAIDILTAQTNRYMEDAKVNTGGDGVITEHQDKLKYIKEQIKNLRANVKEKEGKLGLTVGSGVPTAVIKISARDESEDNLYE